MLSKCSFHKLYFPTRDPEVENPIHDQTTGSRLPDTRRALNETEYIHRHSTHTISFNSEPARAAKSAQEFRRNRLETCASATEGSINIRNEQQLVDRGGGGGRLTP